MCVYMLSHVQCSMHQWLKDGEMCEPASRGLTFQQRVIKCLCKQRRAWKHDTKTPALQFAHWAHPTVHRHIMSFVQRLHKTEFATSWFCPYLLHWCTAACWSENMQYTAQTSTEICWAFHCAGVLPWHGAHHVSEGDADGWYAMIKFVNQCVTKNISDSAGNNVHLIGIDPTFVQVLNASVWFPTLPKHTSSQNKVFPWPPSTVELSTGCRSKLKESKNCS